MEIDIDKHIAEEWKKLLWWFGIIISVVVCSMFFSWHGIILFLMLWLPVGIGMASFFGPTRMSGFAFKKTNTGFALRYLTIIVLVLIYAAPVRAFIVMAVTLFPWWGVSNVTQGDVTAINSFFIPQYGDNFTQWVDFYWGVSAACLLLLLAIADSIRRSRLVRQIENLPTSKVRSVAVGFAELSGKAIPLEEADQEAPIINYWYVPFSNNNEAWFVDVQPFYLEDGTGRIRVEPQNCALGSEDEDTRIHLNQAFINKKSTTNSIKGNPEYALMPGDDIYVLGQVSINRQQENKKNQNNDRLILAPGKLKLFGLEFQELFFLSTGSEKTVLERLRASVWKGWKNVVIAMCFSLWLAVYSITDIIQLEEQNIYGAPTFMRVITHTTLEREEKFERSREQRLENK